MATTVNNERLQVGTSPSNKEFQTGIDPNTSPNREGGHKINKKLIAALSGVALTVMLGLGIGNNIASTSAEKAKAETTPTKIETVDTQSSNELASLESSVEAQAPAMARYEAMDISTFDALPRKQQVVYAQYLIDKTRASGAYENIYTGEDEKNAIEYVAPSINDSGQEILDSWELELQYAGAQHIDGQKEIDLPDTLKILSLAYLYTGEEGVYSNDFINTQAHFKKQSTWSQYNRKHTAIETSDTINYNYDTNTVMPAKIVKLTDEMQGGKVEYAEFVLTQTTDINSAKEARYAWSLVSIAPTPEGLKVSVDNLNSANQ